jgi:cell division protein FtsI/penicillin-binding protein 2
MGSMMRGLLVAAVLLHGPIQARASSVPAALSRAIGNTAASAVVLDLRTGAVLATAGASRRGEPGSTIKPLLLAYALEHGIVHSETEVYCRRDLHIAGRAVACTHPDDQPVFDAERALAESCNTWFAEMARRFSGSELEAALQQSHLPHTSMTAANVEQRQLAVLGLGGVWATPLQLAQSYRQMLRQLPSGGTVARDLRDSVDFGMAHPAAVPGVLLLGKTGTAHNPGEAWTHGWFAGALPGRLVLVVYVPRGDGGTAARLAQGFFQAIAAEGEPR